MHIADQILVLLHLIGFASLFGGFLVQTRSPHPEVNAAMLHGALLQLLTGAGLVALMVVAGDRIHYAPLSVKLFLTLLIVLLVAKNRKFQSIPKGLWALIGGMTLANAAIAVFW